MDLRTGAAFWAIQSGVIRRYSRLDADERCAIAVIGAGITGALVAERLAAANVDVVVLDKATAAMGSTAASTGLLQYETDRTLTEVTARLGRDHAVRSWRAGLDAIDEIERLCQDDDCGFARRPSLYLASSRDDVTMLETECRARERAGFDVTWVDRRALKSTFDIRGAGAIVSRGDGEVDSFRLAHHALGRAQRRGARIYEHATVTGIRKRKGGLTLQTAGGPTVAAGHVVIAAGYEVARWLGVERGHLHSTWAVASAPMEDPAWWPHRSLVWETRRPYLYMRTTADGRVMLGGEDEPGAERHEDRALFAAKVRRILRGFSAWFPERTLEIEFAWAGVFGSTPDGLPYIGTIPRHPRMIFALGYGGNGITFGMVAARLIHEWALGKTDVDGKLFAMSRRPRPVKPKDLVVRGTKPPGL